MQPIIEAAHKFCGFDAIEDVFYSRKKFARPDLQKAPHQSFEDEVRLDSCTDWILIVNLIIHCFVVWQIEYLQEVFNGGDAYALGRLNSECWYLYTLNKPMSIKQADQTLEIIMTDLDPEVMSIFTKEVCSTSEECTEVAKQYFYFPNY